MTREREFWTPEPLFAGQTVFVLASGPSLTPEVCRKVEGRPSIVVNSSVLLAPWADVWFFTDSGVYDRHKNIVASFRGLVVTMSKKAKREMPDRVRRVQAEWMPGFPKAGTSPIRQGRSSGQTAIGLAVAMGAARIAGCGFDMRTVDGREHHHDEYAGRPRDLAVYDREFLPAFKGWHAAALSAGVEIVNCTPGSAVTEFPFATLDEVLSCARS